MRAKNFRWDVCVMRLLNKGGADESAQSPPFFLGVPLSSDTHFPPFTSSFFLTNHPFDGVLDGRM
jgi:hypothetical protein